MAARTSVQIQVGDAGALEELESAMSTGDLEAVIVGVPDDSSALLNAREFRQLIRVARANGVEIEIATDDPLRRELAAILGAHVVPHTAPSRPAAAQTRLPFAEPAPNEELTRRIAPPAIQAAPVATEADDAQASYSFVLTPPTPRRVEQLRPAQVADAEIEAKVRRDEGRRVPTLRRKRLRVLGGMATLGALLAVATLLVAFYVPTATVTLVPAVAPVSVDFTYGVAAPGATFDLAVEPRALTATVTTSATIATTGDRVEPDGVARGELLLTNPTTSEVTIAAGTLLSADDGQAFATTADVVVPAADPFGTMTFGSATVEVAAQVAGPDGNINADALNGQLESGVFYSNRDALSGGSVKHIQTVAQADLDALRAKATTDLQGKAAAALPPTLQTGEQLLDGSVIQGTPSVAFDHQAGDDATALNVSASLAVSGRAYNPDAMQAQARDEAGKRLAAAVGPGTVVLADSVSVGQPQPISGRPAPAFRIQATANTRAVLGDAALARLQDDLAGASDATVEQRIAALPGVARYSIAYGPSWLPRRMPRLSSKITIKVSDGTGAGSATAPTSSAPGAQAGT